MLAIPFALIQKITKEFEDSRVKKKRLNIVMGYVYRTIATYYDK